MKDQSRKLQEMKENSEAVFQELFGINKSEEEVESGAQGEVEKVGEGTYRLGNSILQSVEGVSEYELLNFNFKASPLSWLLDAKFEGELDLKLTGGNPELVGFQGKWYEGTFKGKFFGIESEFYGGQFGSSDSSPVFLPPYTGWKTSPHFFYGGRIKRHQEGILGKPSLPMGNIKNSFNILSISPGSTVTLELNGGVKHTITCLKRLGGDNTMFSYKIENGKTQESYSINHDWLEVRGQNKVDFLKNTNINLQTATKSIDIFKLDISEGIVSAVVSLAGTSGAIGAKEPAVSQKELSTNQESYKLAGIPFLGIDKIPRKGGSETSIYFNFPTTNHLKGYKNAIKSLEQNWVKSYITQIKSALDNNIVTGAPVNYPYLSNLIGKDADADISIMDKDLVNSFNGIENFLKYFVDTMVRRVRKTGAEKGLVDVDDKVGKDVIKNKLKDLFGVTTPEAAPSTPKAAVAQKKPKLKRPMAESVREAVRKILGEI